MHVSFLCIEQVLPIYLLHKHHFHLIFKTVSDISHMFLFFVCAVKVC